MIKSIIESVKEKGLEKVEDIVEAVVDALFVELYKISGEGLIKAAIQEVEKIVKKQIDKIDGEVG